MDITRNQYFLFGFVLLLLGAQFRLIDSVELTPEVSRVLVKNASAPVAAVSSGYDAVTPGPPAVKKVVRPPEWIGWALISTGAVLLLHAIAMPKSG